MDRHGVITTVAGTGEAAGSSRDGGPAPEAALDDVEDVAVDSAGNLFISTEGRVRRVDAAATITPVARTR